MKDEKNVNNEIKVEAKDNVEVKEFVNKEFDEMFDVDPFERQKAAEESGVERESNVTVYKTNIPVKKYTSQSRTDGKMYSNYKVAWKRPLYGKVVTYELNLIPAEKRKVLYDMLEAMFGEGDRLDLQILKTESVIDNVKNTRYSMRVAVVDEAGVEIVCPLRAAGAGDRAIFEVLLSLLKEKGVVS